MHVLSTADRRSPIHPSASDNSNLELDSMATAAAESSMWLCYIQTFTAAGNEVLVEPTEARVYHVHALRNALELAHQAPVLYVPHM